MSLLSGTSRQIYVTLCANLLSVVYGTSVGWASSGLPFLQSNQTVLPSGPLTKEGNALDFSSKLEGINLLMDLFSSQNHHGLMLFSQLGVC